ncbi:MAG: 2-keto-4-pentenoate hydratase [Bacillota bacterium]
MDIQAISMELLEAERTRVPVEPLTARFPGLTVEEAYRIQLNGIGVKTAQGRRVIGKKIGLTSKAMQQLLGVNEPDYGHLLDDMLLQPGEPLARSHVLSPKVEGEIAFVLKEKLQGPGVTFADVLRATEGLMAAIEVVDSRIRDWKIKLPDTVADNASAARVVLGSKMIPANDLDLRLVGMVLERNGEVVNTGAGAAVWGHPAAAVAWLANKLAAFGIALEAGEIILSGAVTGAVDARANDVFTVSFCELGSVSLKFV